MFPLECYAHIIEAPWNQLGDRRLSRICKSKESLFLHMFARSDSPCVHHIGVVSESPAQVRLGFYSSKGEGDGFLRFRTQIG